MADKSKDEPTITSEEVELLSQEEGLLTKKEQGEDLESEEQESLDKINSLKDDLKERFKEKEIPEKTKEEILSLQAQKRHFRTKYEKSEEEREKLLKKLEEAKKKAPPEEKSDWQAKVDFLLEHKNYSEEEFKHIATISKEHDIPLDEAAELEKDYIEYRRSKVEKEEKIPKPSPLALKSKELTPKEVAELSEEEHEELWKEDKEKEAGEGI